MAESQKTRSFGSSALALAVTSMVAKLMGAVYRIPLTNILGAVGIGKYQLVFPLFALLLAISCNAVPVAIARLVAHERALEQPRNVQSIMLTSIVYMGVSGLVAMIFMLVIAYPLSLVQGADMYKCYLVLAPVIMVVGFSNAFKGWFLGSGNTMPNCVGQLIEQSVKLVFGLALAKVFSRYGLTFSVLGALLGIAISELLELGVVTIWYAKSCDESKGLSRENFGYWWGYIGKVATPIMASGLIFPLLSFIDSILVVKELVLVGAEYDLAVSEYGLLTGPVYSLVNMPVVVALSLSVAIVPAVSQNVANYNLVSLKEKASMSIKLAVLVGLPCACGMALLARSIVGLLYPVLSEAQVMLATRLLQVQSVGIVFLSLLEVLGAVLQGLGKSRAVLCSIAVGGLVKIGLEIVLIARLGIVGVCIAMVTFYAVSCVIDIVIFRKMVGKNSNLWKNVGKIVLCSVIMSICVVLSTKWLGSQIAKLVVGISVGVVIFGVLLGISGIFGADEIASLSFGKWLSKIWRKHERSSYDNDSRHGN